MTIWSRITPYFVKLDAFCYQACGRGVLAHPIFSKKGRIYSWLETW